EHHKIPKQEHQTREIDQRNRTLMLADELSHFRKDQNKMQEEYWLQKPSSDVDPIDCPIEIVQLSGVHERIEDKRHQAENVKVSRARRGPAPQENIDSNAEVDEGD